MRPYVAPPESRVVEGPTSLDRLVAEQLLVLSPHRDPEYTLLHAFFDTSATFDLIVREDRLVQFRPEGLTRIFGGRLGACGRNMRSALIGVVGELIANGEPYVPAIDHEIGDKNLEYVITQPRFYGSTPIVTNLRRLEKWTINSEEGPIEGYSLRGEPCEQLSPEEAACMYTGLVAVLPTLRQ